MTQEPFEIPCRATTTWGVLRIFLGDMLVLAAVFLVAEAGLRWFAPQNLNRLLRNVYMLTPDTVSGFRFKPGSRTICNNGYGDHEFSINRWGMRDRDYGSKAPGEWRIVVLGDSFSENQALPVDQIYPNVLETDLAGAYPAREFSVLNAGMAGWGVWNYLEFIENVAPATEPDVLVVALTMSGDYVLTDAPPPPPERSLFAGIPIATHASWGRRAIFAAWFANEMLEDHSHAYVAARRLAAFPMRWLGLHGSLGFSPLCTDAELAARVVEPTAAVVAKLVSACNAQRLPVVLMYVPRANSIVPATIRSYVQMTNPDMRTLDVTRPAKLIAEIAARCGMPLYDPSAALAASPEPVYFAGFEHWNAAGNRIVAQGLRGFLEREGLLGAAAVSTGRE